MRLSRDTKQQIYIDAQSRLPEESCGFLVRVGRSTRYVPVANTAQKPADDFRISPQDWAAAEDQGDIVGIVHSHPGQSARLSNADRVSMEAIGLPWLIVEVREGAPVGHQVHQPTGYRAPLVGRPFAHGVLDCYTLVRDYYQREMGIELMDFDREDNWWNEGQDLYAQQFGIAGFQEIHPDNLRQGDLILMQVRAPVANHAGIYLADGKLSTEPGLHPAPGCILHHLYGRDSKRDPFGGMWRESARFYLRHKDSPHG